MAMNCNTVTLHPIPKPSCPPFFIIRQKHATKFYFSCPCTTKTAAVAQDNEGGLGEDPSIYSGSSSSARSQLDLLEQLTSLGPSVDGYESDSSSFSKGFTIRDQLAQLVGDRDDDFSIPLGKALKKVSPKFLTISQKRNIRRQAYLDEVSQRNDSIFFATIGAYVFFPPFIILGVAIATGYVQLFP